MNWSLKPLRSFQDCFFPYLYRTDDPIANTQKQFNFQTNFFYYGNPFCVFSIYVYIYKYIYIYTGFSLS